MSPIDNAQRCPGPTLYPIELNFSIVGDQNEVHENPWVTAPYPIFDADTYPGAEIEGWVTMQAATGEGELVMIFESFYDYSDDYERFFSLE